MPHRIRLYSRIVVVLFALLFLLISQTFPALAATLISLTTGGTSNAPTDIPQALQFVTPANAAYTLDTASIYIRKLPASVTFQYDLYSDAGNVPGVQIALLGSATSSTGGNVIMSVSPSPSVILNANTAYWLVITRTAGDNANWRLDTALPTSALGFTSTRTAENNGTWYVDSSIHFLFSLDGTQLPSTTVSSIARVGASPTNTANVSWTVTFANALTGLSSNNFSLAQTGVSGASITGVTPVGAVPATQWTVTATTGSGDGTLGLNLVNSNALSHFATNAPFTGEGYTIDKSAPVIVSITRLSPNPVTGSPVDVWWRVQFNELVTAGINTAQLAKVTTGTVNDGGSNFTYTPGNPYFDYSANSVAGNGTIGLNYTDISGLTDALGNVQTSTTSFTGEVYTVQNPTTVSITLAGASPTNASSVVWNVNFGQTVTGLTSTNFQLDPVGVSGALITNVGGSGTAWTVTASTGTGNGTLGLSMMNDTNSVTQVTNLPYTGPTYTLDKVGPTVTINQGSVMTDPTSAATITFDVVFSEPVTTFDFTDILLGGTAGATTVSVGGSMASYTVSVSGMTGDGTVSASVIGGAVQDALGNLSSASTSTDNIVTYLHPAIVVSPTSGLLTTEAGGTAPFSIVLNGPPTTDVSIDLSSSSPAEGTVNPPNVTFTTLNWSTPQVVTVTGVDDLVADGNIAYTIITAAAVSGDSQYSGTDPMDVSVTNQDDDTAGIAVSPAVFYQVEGGNGSYQIYLNSLPSVVPVVVQVAFDETQLRVNGNSAPFTLTFSDTTPLTLTFEVLATLDINTNRALSITHTVTNSSASEYPLGMARTVIVNISDAPPPPPSPTCDTENFNQEGVVRTGIPDAIAYAINCRVLYYNGGSTTWMGKDLYSEANLGIAGLLNLGVKQAVDIFSPSGMTYFQGGGVFCLRGEGTLIWLAASGAPRHPEIIGSYTVPEFPGFTCATLFEPGTLILVRDNPVD